MVKQKVRNLIIIVIVVIPVAILYALLTVGSYEVTAQSQPPHKPALVTSKQITGNQVVNAELNFQSVYTTPNALDVLEAEEGEESQLEVVGDLTSGIQIEPYSTNSGSEYVPMSAFRSDGFPGAAVGYRFSVLGGSFPGGYLRNISSNTVCMAAPVYLPNGATVTEFSIYFMDDHPTLDMNNFIRLWRKSLASPGSNADIMASFVSPAGIDSTIIYRGYDNTIAQATVSNLYSYYITICLYGNTGLQHLVYGFRVNHTP